MVKSTSTNADESKQVAASAYDEDHLDEPAFIAPAIDPERPPDPIPAPPMEAKIVVSPRAAATASFIFGFSCLAALSIITAVKDVDVLSTIALSLAIIAFGVQLLVTTAQNQNTAQQSVRSEQLNTQTRTLLAEMQTTARGTETMVREQFGQLLRAFLDAANSAGGGKSFDEAEFEQRLLTNIRREQALRQSASSPPLASATTVSPRRIRREAPPPAVAYQSGPFPTEEEARPVIEPLLRLSPNARERLKQYALDAQTGGGGSTYVGYPVNSTNPVNIPLNSELAQEGFVNMVRVGGDDGPDDGLVYQLTDLGKLATRVVGGTGEVPEWAAPILAGQTERT
jgi:hypothetical protein